MNVLVTAASNFVHCQWDLLKGQSVLMPEQEAKELKAASLVDYDEQTATEKAAPEPENKMAAAALNKAGTAPRAKATKDAER